SDGHASGISPTKRDSNPNRPGSSRQRALSNGTDLSQRHYFGELQYRTWHDVATSLGRRISQWGPGGLRRPAVATVGCPSSIDQVRKSDRRCIRSAGFLE